MRHSQQLVCKQNNPCVFVLFLQRKLEELRKAVRGNEARASELEQEAKKTSNVADIAQVNFSSWVV